ncbi:nephrocystin-4-like [Salvelinus fontinalis]|uniref:nephrocystin-4-like n=1 Tax=Salvelinus fontinalis TaxID=8038 RepID=UPI002486AD6D|nr:nephrocystin-4-like [Salvelinus fontinalis]
MEKSTYKCGVLPQLSFCPSWWLWWSWWSYSPGQMAPSMHWGAAKPSCTSSQQDRTSGRLSLYHGTPRTLLHLLPKDPSKQRQLLPAINETHLVCSLKLHHALEPAMHLFPQNMVPGEENIPGVTPSPTDSYRKP